MKKAAPVKQPAPFFSLAVNYSIDPDAATEDLLEDLTELLGIGTATLVENGPGKLSQTQWAGVYMVQQAHAILDHVIARIEQAAAAATPTGA